ncbi:hypothetical protein ND856_07805 [Leptospira bandrabouensis]|uniref:NADase-type glycan-binding domain-containing protein n=1 Tax=Leptospira bandrabouensis TaxID=2484903 RepID=UPI00223DDEE8|nr:hypothetical protein [Leptospira bandrabouensis]MCW7459938.1 hypothetical protein [Leptospira bandrabouensis]MCW7477185.1 hypothetical protein [Leptospira bandrabouensis]MCW7484867.1 hypothetical protein [Leptospira bandrabouensis]
MNLFLILLLFFALTLDARDLTFEKLYATVNACYKNQKCKQPVASSFLIENGKPKDEYSPEKIHDNIGEKGKDTAWCVSKNQGIGEYIYIPYQNLQGINQYNNIWKRREYFSLFTVVNGFAKSESLYLSNNRVKKITIEVKEIAYTMAVSGPETIAGTDIIVYDGPLLNSIHEVELADSMEEQTFKLKIIPKSTKDGYNQMDLLFKVIINEIYPGSKYKDTCISTASFTMLNPETK